jgi:hypothetical protein
MFIKIVKHLFILFIYKIDRTNSFNKNKYPFKIIIEKINVLRIFLKNFIWVHHPKNASFLLKFLIFVVSVLNF